ncbi:hypothetical protein [Aliiroseovarius sp.]|uniref:hypothetical protein n=1 Tax=Aliiroseovarius sp. TaxID=1872442 RepID=UPI003BABD39A
MISISTLKRFLAEQDGNAVIDWTVLLAGSVMMALAVVMTITDNVDSITEDTSDRMESIEVNPTGSA